MTLGPGGRHRHQHWGWWLGSSVVGCGRRNEGAPTAAVAIAIVNAGVDMVIVFVLAVEGGGDRHRQWWCERRGERVPTCGCIDDHCCRRRRRRRGH